MNKKPSVRERLAVAIELNGGYNHWALSWNVSLHGVRADEVIAAMVNEHYQNEFDLMVRYPEVKALVESHMEDPQTSTDVVENMRSSLDDGDTFRMWCPEIAAKHGFEYKGKGAESPFNVGFAFEGRQGKHLVVTRFEGLELTKHLMPEITDPCSTNRPTNLWCRKLLGMIEEWGRCFTPQAVKEEEAHALAWVIQMQIERGEERT